MIAWLAKRWPWAGAALLGLAIAARVMWSRWKGQRALDAANARADVLAGERDVAEAERDRARGQANVADARARVAPRPPSARREGSRMFRSPTTLLLTAIASTTLLGCCPRPAPPRTIRIPEPVVIEPPPCYSAPMPRRCGPGEAELDAGVRRCWAFTVEPVPNRGERAYLQAVFAWGAGIEAACVRPAPAVTT